MLWMLQVPLPVGQLCAPGDYDDLSRVRWRGGGGWVGTGAPIERVVDWAGSAAGSNASGADAGAGEL